MKSICSDNKLNGKFIHLLNCLWRQDFGQLYLWHLVWFLSVWIFFMVDSANPLRWCWCWWWRWHGWRWWGWCKGRNGQTSRTFFLSTPFFVDKVLCGKFSIHWTFSFLWLFVVFDGNVLDMKALFGHICSLMSIKRGRDREICQKLQKHNPWLLTSGRLWLSLEIKTLILKQNPGGTNIRSITKHGSLCLRLGQHQGCSGPLVEVLAGPLVGPLVEHLVVEALVGQHDPL